MGFELLKIWIVLTFFREKEFGRSVSFLSFSTKWLVHHFQTFPELLKPLYLASDPSLDLQAPSHCTYLPPPKFIKFDFVFRVDEEMKFEEIA